MYINFQQNRVSRTVRTVHTNIFAKNCKLHKFATTNRNFKISIISDKHNRITYMYINFEHNPVSRSVSRGQQASAGVSGGRRGSAGLGRGRQWSAGVGRGRQGSAGVGRGRQGSDGSAWVSRGQHGSA